MTKRNERFSLRARIKSFSYALQGIFIFFRQEHNAIIHLIATLMVIVLAVLLKISPIEVTVLSLSMGFVWVTEIINTAIEKIMDHVTTEKHPAVGRIKDMSAAAVLVAAITAVIVGCFVFIPKI